jgi:hypothetical protein
MANGLHFLATTALAIGDNRGLIKDDALSFDVYKGVSGTKVDSHVAGKPVEEASEHFSLAILSLFSAMIRTVSNLVVPLHGGQIKAE